MSGKSSYDVDAIEREIERLNGLVEDLETQISWYFSKVRVKSNPGMEDTWSTKRVNTGQRQEILQVYEKWVIAVLPIVKNHHPDNIDEFLEYRTQFKKAICLEYNPNRGKNNVEDAALDRLKMQLGIISSTPDKIRAKQLVSPRHISSAITTDELEKGQRLFEGGNTRAAGMLAGVALERHLMTMCESADREIDFASNDGISALAQKLSEAGEIDDDEMRQLDWFAGIRNNCSHANDMEPDEGNVELLLTQSKDFIKAHEV